MKSIKAISIVPYFKAICYSANLLAYLVPLSPVTNHKNAIRKEAWNGPLKAGNLRSTRLEGTALSCVPLPQMPEISTFVTPNNMQLGKR